MSSPGPGHLAGSDRNATGAQGRDTDVDLPRAGALNTSWPEANLCFCSRFVSLTLLLYCLYSPLKKIKVSQEWEKLEPGVTESGTGMKCC